MASEAHDVRKQKALHIEGHPIDLPRKRISSSTKKIMKEVSCFFINGYFKKKSQNVVNIQTSSQF